MDKIKIKIKLKQKKIFNKILNKISRIDETSIIKCGDLQDNYFKKISTSLEKALAIKSKLEPWILDLDGLSGRKYRHLINNLISSFYSPHYLEIGSYMGSTACSAAFKNRLDITCIDNWSEVFDSKYERGENIKNIFTNNINKCTDDNINLNIHNCDFRVFDYSVLKPVDICLYDGPHHREDHFDAVNIIQTAVNKKYILIVDDWDWLQVRQGTMAAIKKLNLKIVSSLEIRTTLDDTSPIINGKNSDWHNGYCFFVISN